MTNGDFTQAPFKFVVGSSSELTEAPTWSPPTKIAARYLAPYLDERDRLAAGLP